MFVFFGAKSNVILRGEQIWLKMNRTNVNGRHNSTQPYSIGLKRYKFILLIKRHLLLCPEWEWFGQEIDK